MNFYDYVAGILPIWNQVMYYAFQMMNTEFWIQDDPDDVNPNDAHAAICLPR